MPIQATFTADFTKWDAALKNATTNLKSFEVATKNVGQQLQRAFSTFSGEKVIRDANLAVAAVGKLGGAAKLTASEQARLNATLTEAIAKYKALGQVAPKEMQDLANATKQVVAPTLAASESVGSLVARYVSIGAAIALAKTAIGGLIDFLASSVTSYAQAEAAQNRMVAALRAQGTATPTVIKQYAQLAATIQRTTAFSDDAANEMQALFIAIGNVGPAQMEKATTAATDLAAGLGIDLVQAATLVSKALAGNTGALGRYGIKLTEAQVAAEGASAVFGAINDRFGGQAAAQLDTYSGKLEQLANNWDNVKEAIGRTLVTNEIATFAMNKLADALIRASEESEDTSVSVAAAFQGISQPVAYAVSLLEDYLGVLNEIDRMGRGIKAPALPQAQVLPNITGAGLVEWERQNEIIDKAKKAAEAAAKAFAELRAQVTGAKMLADLKQVAKVWNSLSEGQKKSTITTAALAKLYDSLGLQLKDIPPHLRDMVEAMADASRELGDLAQEYANVREEVFKLDLLLDRLELAADAEEARTVLREIGAELNQVGARIDEAFDLKDDLDAVVADIRRVNTEIEELFDKAAEKSESFGKVLGDNLEQALGNIPQIITDGLIHGASFEDIAAAIGTQIGAAIGGAIGFALAGPLGEKIGEAFGALLGPLLDKIIKTRAEETQERIREEYGVAISEGLSEAIEDASARFEGDREAAKIFNLDKIIAEGGGLNTENIDRMFGKFRDVFVKLETGVYDLAEAQEVLNKNFKTFADYVTQDGAFARKELLEIIRLNEEMGTHSSEIREFVDAQARDALAGLATFVETRGGIATSLAEAQKKLTELREGDGTAAEIAKATAEVAKFQAQLAAIPLTAATAEAFGSSLFAIFDQLARDGVPALEIIKQMDPVIASLDAQLKAAGLGGGAAFENIRNLAALARDEIAGPAFEAISGLGQALHGLHNSGLLTQETFEGIAEQITATYQGLVAQGKGGADALRLMGGPLQDLWELQQDFGYEVDDATQALLDEAKAAGVVGDQHRTAQEKMALAMERTAELLELIAIHFGVTLPENIKKTKEAVEKIPKQIDIEVNYDVERLPDPDRGPSGGDTYGGANPDSGNYRGGTYTRGYAKGGVVYAQHGMWAPRGTDTVPAMLTPGEVVLPREVVAALRSSSGGGAVTVNLSISAIDGADVERVVRSPEFRRALTSAVSGNVGGYRTDLRTAIGVR